MDENKYGGDYLDWNNDWQYPLQWIYESQVARDKYRFLLWRAEMAMLGLPSRNLYQEELESNLKQVSDPTMKEACKKACVNLPAGRSLALRKAVDNRANQMASGVDSYEYQINDPYMVIDADTEDLLAAKCEQDYHLNHLERLSEVFSDDLTVAGVAAVLVKYDPVSDRNKVIRINPKNIGWDTRYSSTGVERFRYYQTMISWATLKKMIGSSKDELNPDLEVPDASIFSDDGKFNDRAKVRNHKIETINGLDIYVQDMNKLATATQLQGDWIKSWGEYSHDLHKCYNLNWYHTLATDPEAKTKSGYNGDDVELTVLYDLDRKIEFKIINRRYVISKNCKAFRRKIVFPITNPITGEVHNRIDDFYLDCPLKFQFAKPNTRDTAPYPVAPIFPLLDLHDELCAWRAKRDHVSRILSILRIETNSADANSLRGVMNVMGVVLDDIEGDIGTINFQYDYTPIDTEIQYLETTIRDVLHAYDDFDAMQAMGDRASAAESGMAQGAIAQGLTTLQSSIMQLYADIARQCIANRVAYSPRQDFPVVSHGVYSSITIQQMALNAVISVKPKLAKKVQERSIAANAITLLGTLGDRLNSNGIAYLMEQALMGTTPRKLAQDFVVDKVATDQEMAVASLEAQNMANQLAQNQKAYESDPISYEVDNIMNTQDPETIDAIINGLGQSNNGVNPNDIIAANQAMHANGGNTPVASADEIVAQANIPSANPSPRQAEETLATESEDIQRMADLAGVDAETMLSMLNGTAPQRNSGSTPSLLDMQQQPGAMTSGLNGLTSDNGSAIANPNSMV